MADLRYVATLSGGAAAYSSSLTGLAIHAGDRGTQLYAITRDGGGISAFDLGPGAAALLSQTGFGARVGHLGTPGLAVLETGTGTMLQPTGLLAGGQSAHWLNASGQIGGQVSGAGTQAPADLLALAQVAAGGRAYAVGSRAGEGAPRLYAVQEGGGLVEQAARLESLSSGIGFDTPGAVVTASLGGVAHAILGGAGSSSLTVLRVGAGGQLAVTDHVIDSLDTRFQGGTALETFTLGDRVFVLAGGADDGFSLLTLTPAGQLIHLRSFADTAATTLENVTALAAAEVGGVAQIFAAGETEAGITQFAFDPGGIGRVLDGGGRGTTSWWPARAAPGPSGWRAAAARISMSRCRGRRPSGSTGSRRAGGCPRWRASWWGTWRATAGSTLPSRWQTVSNWARTTFFCSDPEGGSGGRAPPGLRDPALSGTCIGVLCACRRTFHRHKMDCSECLLPVLPSAS
ncbi:hypothetical protein JYP51_22630 [Ponticoccus gilvus]|nr:hypothetical protein [Enemella evansiae]